MRILTRGRQMAEKRMRSTWTCTRTTRSWSDASGTWTETSETVYDGKGRLKPATQQAQREIEAGATVTLHGTVLALPTGAAQGLRIDDILECTGSLDNPALVGVRVRVKALPTGEQTTEDRYGVEREVPQ